MQTSTAGLMALISHEGIVLSRYKDSVGVWTIGVGHTKAAGNPDPATYQGALTVAEALGLLRHDIVKYEAAVNKAIKVPLAQHEFDALVSFHYNTGAIARASLAKSINAGNKALAAKQFMNWTKPAEITKRREAERDLFARGVYPKPVATLYPATPDGKVQWKKGVRVDLVSAVAASKPTPPALRVPVHVSPDGPLSGPVPVEPETGIPASPFGGPLKLAVGAFLAGLIGLGSWLAGLPCDVLGVFCR